MGSHSSNWRYQRVEEFPPALSKVMCWRNDVAILTALWVMMRLLLLGPGCCLAAHQLHTLAQSLAIWCWGAALTSGEGDQDYGAGDQGKWILHLLLKRKKKKENCQGPWTASSNSSLAQKILRAIQHYLKDYWGKKKKTIGVSQAYKTQMTVGLFYPWWLLGPPQLC